MLSDGLKSHFNQTQNVVDVISYLLNLSVIVFRMLAMNEAINMATLRILGALAGVFLWFQIVFWLRLFDNTAQYVSLILRTINAIFSFMVLMLMIMFGFGTAFYILQLNRIYKGDTEDDLVFSYRPGDYLFYSAFINQYFIVLGDFEGMQLNDENTAGELFVTVFFVMTTFLSQITILNMLIAIMGDTFS